MTWSQWAIGTLAVFAYLLGALRLAHQSGLSPAFSWLLVLLALFAGLNLQHLMNGLETTLAMASMIWRLILFKDPIPKKSGGILIGALPFIRPELIALSLLWVIRWLAQAYSLGLLKKELLRVLLTMAIGAAIPILFIIASGGHLFPETASAKAYFLLRGVCH